MIQPRAPLVERLGSRWVMIVLVRGTSTAPEAATPGPKLAVLGLGTMGRAIAESASRAGTPVVVWNRNPDRARPLTEAAVAWAPSVLEAVEQADVVITMVTDADAVMSVAVEQGLLNAMPSDAVWAQMSTIGVEGTERVAAMALEQRPDVHFVDAPVSGSKVAAEQGNLLIFASGRDEARDRVAPVFDAIGHRTIWLGPAGQGTRMKLVNNVLLAFSSEGIANSIALAHRLRVPTASVLEALDGSPLLSPWQSGKLRRIADEEYSAEFALALALKDVLLALAEGGPQRLPVLAALAEEWSAVAARGLGDEDLTVVTRALAAEAERADLDDR
jgi:3-hydroxyisobutyrate dehydrogenase